MSLSRAANRSTIAPSVLFFPSADTREAFRSLSDLYSAGECVDAAVDQTVRAIENGERVTLAHLRAASLRLFCSDLTLERGLRLASALAAVCTQELAEVFISILQGTRTAGDEALVMSAQHFLDESARRGRLTDAQRHAISAQAKRAQAADAARGTVIPMLRVPRGASKQRG